MIMVIGFYGRVICLGYWCPMGRSMSGIAVRALRTARHRHQTSPSVVARVWESHGATRPERSRRCFTVEEGGCGLAECAELLDSRCLFRFGSRENFETKTGVMQGKVIWSAFLSASSQGIGTELNRGGIHLTSTARIRDLSTACDFGFYEISVNKSS